MAKWPSPEKSFNVRANLIASACLARVALHFRQLRLVQPVNRRQFLEQVLRLRLRGEVKVALLRTSRSPALPTTTAGLSASASGGRSARICSNRQRGSVASISAITASSSRSSIHRTTKLPITGTDASSNKQPMLLTQNRRCRYAAVVATSGAPGCGHRSEYRSAACCDRMIIGVHGKPSQ